MEKGIFASTFWAFGCNLFTAKCEKLLAAVCTVLALCLALGGQACAQDDPDAGISPFSTQLGGAYDSVNVANGNINLAVPIRNKIGAIPFSYKLVGNSRAWLYGGTQQGYTVETGTTLLPGQDSLPIVGSPSTTVSCPNGGSTTEFGPVGAVDSTGALHIFPFTVDSSGCLGNSSATAIAPDGSGYILTATASNVNNVGQLQTTLWDRSGNKVQGGTVTDPHGNALTGAVLFNGNILTGGTAADTLGTTPLTATFQGFYNGSPDTYSYTYYDSSGTLQTAQYKVQYTSYTSYGNFGCPSGIVDRPNTTAPVYLPTSISGPTGTMTLSYELTPGVTQPGPFGNYSRARLVSIALPSGGSIGYSYSGDFCNGNSETITRTVNDANGNSGQWTYAYGAGAYGWPLANNTNTTTTVTDPTGNYTVYSFQGGLQTERQSYNRAGTLLSTSITCYNGNYSQCAAGTNLPASPTSITQTDVYALQETGSPVSVLETKYDYSGNVTEVTQYDRGQAVGQAPTGFPLLDKIISYGSWNGSACSAVGGFINDHPCRVLVSGPNAGGTGQYGTAQDTRYIYDSTGNLLETDTLVSGTNNYLSSYATYQTNGAVKSTTDVNGAVTTVTGYACNGLLPASRTNAAGLSASQAWDCNGGVVTSATDYNGNTTYYSYRDPLWRETKVSNPDGGETDVLYATTAPPWSVSTTTKVDSSGHAVSTVSTYDGLARVINTTDSSPLGTIDKVDTTYDLTGRVYSVSNPYVIATDPTYGITYYAYDGLGRLATITRPDNSQVQYKPLFLATKVQDEGNNGSPGSRITKILQNDVLGRLASVCEVSGATQQGSSGAPAACQNQDIAGTGFQTSYGYDPLGNLTSVTQGALSPRTFQYDGLSRLTQAVNPESGTTSYTYDTASKGDLYQRSSPKPGVGASGNVVATYAFDALHRMTSVGYNDGATPTVTMSYDQPWTGTSAVNTAGQLTHVATGSQSARSFNYDVMGRVVDEWQATPYTIGSNSNPWHLNYQYNYLGQVTSANNGLIYASGQTMAFTSSYPDGRLSSVTGSWNDGNHPAALVSGLTYNALGSPVAATLGNGVTESYGYQQRGWPQFKTVTGAVQTQSAASGSGSATVGGPGEQSRPGTPATGSTGSVAVNDNGDACTYQYVPAPPPGYYMPFCTYSGVTVTVNGVPAATGFYQNTSSLVSALVSAVNGNSSMPVTASASGNSVVLNSKTAGASTNYSFWVTACELIVVNGSPYGPECPSSTATATASGSSLTGGTNAVPATYDSGTVWVSINGGAQVNVNYAQGDTPQTVAQKLQSQLAGNSLVNVSLQGSSALTLTAIAQGSGTNYSVVPGASDSGQFSQPSFSIAVLGQDGHTPNQLTGGQNAGTGPGTVYNYSLNYAPDGNVLSANDAVNGNWSYAYDDFNRLAQASGPAAGQGCAWSYDRYGNRWGQSSYSGANCPATPLNTFNSNGRNQPDNYCFDAAGNQVAAALCGNLNNVNVNNYDAEGRLTSIAYNNAPQATYVYDDAGRRIRKTVGGTSVDYIYDVAGNAVAEINSSGAWNRVEVYAGGGHLATYYGGTGGTTYFHHHDWLGSARVRTNMQGMVAEACSNLPFGDLQQCTNSDLSPLHFTGQQRDGEPGLEGLDYFKARYYSSSIGRFMTPDPGGVAFSDPWNPQSWNLYSYVQNDPVINLDPDGMDCVTDNGDGTTSTNIGDCANESEDAANNEYYIDCDGCTANATGAILDAITGALYLTDANGNGIPGTTVFGFADPAGLSPQVGSDTSTIGTTTTIDLFGTNWQSIQWRHGTHPFRDNNPGDILSGRFVNGHGAIGSDGRFGVFPSAGTGKAALDALLHSPSYNNLSVNDAVSRYAPAFENNTAGYQQFLQNVVGVGGNTPLSSLSPNQFSALENGIARYEGFNAAGNYSITATSVIY
jgi:RHS repeat-associated protein